MCPDSFIPLLLSSCNSEFGLSAQDGTKMHKLCICNVLRIKEKKKEKYEDVMLVATEMP